MLNRKLAALTSLLIIAGCAVNPTVYSENSPELRIEEYFAGKTRGWGIVQGRSGEVKRRFVVDMNGSWEGEEFVLRENFRYDDGETDYREWRIRVTGAHEYEGVAGDVNGKAEGEAYGNALSWHYSLNLEVEGRTWAFSFNDWMFLHEDGVLLNRATFSKFGIRLGEVFITFSKPEEAAGQPER